MSLDAQLDRGQYSAICASCGRGYDAHESVSVPKLPSERLACDGPCRMMKRTLSGTARIIIGASTCTAPCFHGIRTYSTANQRTQDALHAEQQLQSI